MNTSISLAIQTLYEHALRLSERHAHDLQCIERPSLELIRGRARGNCVEIGTRHGISALALLAGAEHVYTIDIDKSCRGIFPPEWPLTFIHNEGAKACNGWTRPVHVLLIDGNHTSEAVRAELEGWAPHLVEGADIFLHDCYLLNDIRKAISEFCKQHSLTVLYHGILGHIIYKYGTDQPQHHHAL